MTDETLQQAIAYFKSGNRLAALSLLKKVIQTNPNNAAAWSWLYLCVDSIEQKKDCLNQVLRIQPDNQKAKHALSQLELRATLTREIDSPYHQSQESSTQAFGIPTNIVSPQFSKSIKKKTLKWLWIPAIVLLSLLGFFLLSISMGWFNLKPFTNSGSIINFALSEEDKAIRDYYIYYNACLNGDDATAEEYSTVNNIVEGERASGGVCFVRHDWAEAFVISSEGPEADVSMLAIESEKPIVKIVGNTAYLGWQYAYQKDSDGNLEWSWIQMYNIDDKWKVNQIVFKFDD